MKIQSLTYVKCNNVFLCKEGSSSLINEGHFFLEVQLPWGLSKCLRLKALTESFHKGCQTYFSLDSVRKSFYFCLQQKKTEKRERVACN